MSDSLAHEDGLDPQGLRPGSLDAELEAEIADHLAMSAAEFARRGQSAEEARNSAVARFGDVANVKRRMWWVRMGDKVMFRALVATGLCVLALGVAAIGWGTLRMQQMLAEQQRALNAEWEVRLAKLGETQKALLDQQRPAEIVGRAYLGEKDKPAAGVRIDVYQYPNQRHAQYWAGTAVRQVDTDRDGRFDTGPLPDGVYCMVAPLQMPRDAAPDKNQLLFTRLQSKPALLTAGSKPAELEFDLLASSKLRLTAEVDLNEIEVGGHSFAAMLSFPIRSLVQSDQAFPAQPEVVRTDSTWPAAGPSRDVALPADRDVCFYLPAGQYRFGGRNSALFRIVESRTDRLDTSPESFYLNPGEFSVRKCEEIELRLDTAESSLRNYLGLALTPVPVDDLDKERLRQQIEKARNDVAIELRVVTIANGH